MNPTEYTAAAELTNNMNYDLIAVRLESDEMIDLIHASLGVVTESAELADMLKKHIFYGKPIDTVNIKEECGDILWYITIICRRYNVSFEQLMADNIAKLRKRFPNRFTEHDANNRDTVNELSHILPIGNHSMEVHPTVKYTPPCGGKVGEDAHGNDCLGEDQ